MIPITINKFLFELKREIIIFSMVCKYDNLSSDDIKAMRKEINKNDTNNN